MRKPIFVGLLLCAAALSGCSVPTAIQSQTSAASEVANNKAFYSPVHVEYAFQPSDVDVTVHVIGQAGSACSFPLSMSQAFYQTFDAVDNQAFHNLGPANTTGAYTIRFEINSFDNSLVFAGGTAVAHSDLTLRVSVSDPSSHEINRQFVRGSGYMQSSSFLCKDGEPAVADAVQKALR